MTLLVSNGYLMVYRTAMKGKLPLSNDILHGFLQDQGILVLDGGLATELESLGHDLNHPLWSARLLSENPLAIRDIHRTYLEAGADCITTSSYQASFEGFAREGFSPEESHRLLRRSVELAVEARDQFLKGKDPRRIMPLVAASIGPYGAALADGSEYHGNYAVGSQELRDLHEARWQVLAESEADLLACETIPSALEAEVLLELIRQTPETPVWVSFTCRDSTRIRDGSQLEECVQIFRDSPNVIAVGINCTAPRWVPGLIQVASRGAPQKPIIVYPNSGEIYEAELKVWVDGEVPPRCDDWARLARQWFDYGARLIGGCCRTGPQHVRAIRQALRN